MYNTVFQMLSVLYTTNSLDETFSLTKHESSRLTTLTYLLKVVLFEDTPEVLQSMLLQFLQQVPHQVRIRERSTFMMK